MFSHNKKLKMFLLVAVLFAISFFVFSKFSSDGVGKGPYVFFGNLELNPEDDCESVFPISTGIEGVGDPESVVERMLLGPDESQRARGYFSSINSGVEVLSFNLERGVAYIDFSTELDEGVAGSCRVMAIQAQIENTLLQFEEISRVVVSVEGESEEVLQP